MAARRMLVAVAALGALLSACAASREAQRVAVALTDPAELLARIEGDLRLLVFPASAGGICTSATGLLSPDPPDISEQPGAEVDVSFAVDGAAMVSVSPGDHVVLVRGRGTDLVSGRPDAVIASGCAATAIGSGGTREVEIELHEVSGSGVCGDGVLSPDEHCEDSNVVTGDGCDASCRSEPFMVNTTAGGGPSGAAIGWTDEERALVAFESGDGALRMRLLDERAEPIASPAYLQTDEDVEALSGTEAEAAAAVGASRALVAWSGIAGRTYDEEGDVRVRLFDLATREPLGDGAGLVMDSSDAQRRPSAGAMPDGTVLVVFEHAGSATGLAGRVIPAGASAPSGGDAFDIGLGLTSAADPAVAAYNAGFIVAFSAGASVYYQRFDGDGAAVDATPLAIASGGGSHDQPAVATLVDGRALAAWRRDDGVRPVVLGRVIGADGALSGDAFEVATSAAAEQSEPVVAAGRGRFVVAWRHGDEAVRARVFAADGSPALNREAPPSTDDFTVADSQAFGVVLAAGGTGSAGAWIAVWSTTRPGAAGAVYARRVALP